MQFPFLSFVCKWQEIEQHSTKSINLIGAQYNTWWRTVAIKLEINRSDQQQIRRKQHRKFRKHCIRKNVGMAGRPAREVVWATDAMESENNCLLEKDPEIRNIIGKEAMNVFSNGFLAIVLKWSLRLNVRRARDFQINQHVVGAPCARDSEPEDWNHVIKRSCVETNRNEHLSKTRRKLEKGDETNADKEKSKRGNQWHQKILQWLNKFSN